MAKHEGMRLTREQIKQYADVAARLRHLVSQRTLAKYRALQMQHPGTHPRVGSIQLGGGAALAGRDSSTLLVDARGRWHVDGSENLAQVGQQLQGLYRARFGDVREVAGPGERIPLEAVRYWEDSLAVQGEVIDGVGTLRTENNKLLVEIKPLDGSPSLTVEVAGTVAEAPGFPSEHIPGSPRGVSAGEAILSLERAARKIAGRKGPLHDEAVQLLAKLQKVTSARDADLAQVAAILHDEPAELLNALRETDTNAAKEKSGASIGTPVESALGAVQSAERWEGLMRQDAADGERQIFFSKEANTQTIKEVAKKRDDVKRTWVFAGAGGNAVSAAEIILSSTKNAEVTLVATGQPAGLFENGQFRSMAQQHGDTSVAEVAGHARVVLDLSGSTKRLHMVIDKNLNLTTPKLAVAPDGSQRVELQNSTKDGSSETVLDPMTNQGVAGDMFVTALGSPGQLPPEIATLALEARRRDPKRDQHPDPQKRPVWVEANFATVDKRYLGYTAHIRIGGKHRKFRVRGAASRYGFLPHDEFKRMGPAGERALERIKKASADDAHAKSGSFDAGFGPTATQTSQQHVDEDGS
jgi:hypothetical protein